MDSIIEKARMQQKHDTASNWTNFPEFVPKPGEIIIYDKDENVKKQRIKIGDGESQIAELGAISGEVYAQRKEPKNAGEGAIWIDPEDAYFEGLDSYEEREIIGYLYNNTKLPKLPNWDKATYPFGIIKKDGVNYVFEIHTTIPIPAYEQGELHSLVWTTTSQRCLYWTYSKTSDSWIKKEDNTAHESSVKAENIIWVSKTINNGDTIALEYTEPTELSKRKEVATIKSDWNSQNEKDDGYVKNRPFWNFKRDMAISWDESKTNNGICYMTSLTPKISEISELEVYIADQQIPYSDFTIYPGLPQPEEVSSYRYQLYVFKFPNGEIQWNGLEIFYSDAPFVWTEQNYVTNSATALHKVLNLDEEVPEGSEWLDGSILAPNELICTYTMRGDSSVGQRFYANHNILLNGEIILGAYEISPMEYGELWEYGGYISTYEELEKARVAPENTGAEKFFVLSGSLANMASDCSIVVYFDAGANQHDLAYIIATPPDDSFLSGTYFLREGASEMPFIALMNFKYSTIKTSNTYRSLFKDTEASNVYALGMDTLVNMYVNPLLISAELARFKMGDIVLLPRSLFEEIANV